MKLCPDCNTEKSLSEFYNDRTKSRDGFNRICKGCCKVVRLRHMHKDLAGFRKKALATRTRNRDKNREGQKRWYQENKGRQASAIRERRYGISDEQFAQFLSSQNNKCAICAGVFSVLGQKDGPHIDH